MLTQNRMQYVVQTTDNMSTVISNLDILGGKPIIKNTRISVEIILEWIASGATEKDIVQYYPHLSVEDVRDAVRCATSFVRAETSA